LKNPAFGTAQIRELTEIFIDKSIELRDVWALESMKPEKNGRIDVLSWLGRTTLDVIGLAGGFPLTAFAKKSFVADEMKNTFKGLTTILELFRVTQTQTNSIMPFKSSSIPA
jgi:hypothetical protein